MPKLGLFILAIVCGSAHEWMALLACAGLMTLLKLCEPRPVLVCEVDEWDDEDDDDDGGHPQEVRS